MTIYPFILHLGPFEITGYGIMMMVGFLMGGWLITIELRRRGLYEEYAADITVAAVVGGIIGAKLWYWILNPGTSLFSRGGLVWYGGFTGGGPQRLAPEDSVPLDQPVVRPGAGRRLCAGPDRLLHRE
jgi:prolipoprotein diacylglyceryltransferase